MPTPRRTLRSQIARLRAKVKERNKEIERLRAEVGRLGQLLATAHVKAAEVAKLRAAVEGLVAILGKA